MSYTTDFILGNTEEHELDHCDAMTYLRTFETLYPKLTNQFGEKTRGFELSSGYAGDIVERLDGSLTAWINGARCDRFTSSYLKHYV